MSRLTWNDPGTHFYETGCDRGVMYPTSGPGVAWNGLISVSESVQGGESQSYYADGVKFLEVVMSEDFKADLEAFAAPVEFLACDGAQQLAAGLFATQQPRKSFGLSYRTRIGNDQDDDLGYKLHLVYNAVAAPSSRDNKSLSDQADPTHLKWTINTVPPPASTFKPTAHLVVDSTKATNAFLAVLENNLYGTPGTDPALPSPQDVISILTVGHA